MHRRSICKAHLGECFLHTHCCPYASSWPHCIPSCAGGRLPTCLPQLSRPVSLDFFLCCAVANCSAALCSASQAPLHLAQATLRQQGLRCQRLTARHIAHAALSMPQTTDIQKLNDEDRTELAHRLGYRQIGRELPDDVTLGQIIKSMPQEVRTLLMDKHLDVAHSCTGRMVLCLTGCCLAEAAALGRGCCSWLRTLLQSHRLPPGVLGPSCDRPSPPLQPLLQCSSQCTAVKTCSAATRAWSTPPATSHGLTPCSPCPAGF